MDKERKTSIVDVPRMAGAEDLLGVDLYTNALIKFIKNADTPITIAIQGEWGSGKTSMLNQIQQELCFNDSAEFYGIWMNTWQYSLLSDEEVILTKIINAITDKTINEIKKRHPNKYNDNFEKIKKVGGALFKGMLKLSASHVAGSAGTGVVDELAGGGEMSLTVNDLRENLGDVIIKSILDDDKRKGFVFFIDDLDRIEPAVAVMILELLKNIFDIENCIFVLAIDYDVVVKGLEPKFGKLTEENEREFRSFFDKIIQLPFSMPVSRYDIDDFIIKILDDVGYLTDNERKNDDFKRVLSAMARYSVGKNPRGLKRLTNSLSLINFFNELDETKEIRNDEWYEKLMNIGLICCQIAYPFVYNLMVREPNFKSWTETTASRFRLKPLNEDEIEVLNQSEEFDEEWEQVLFRACQRDPYLRNNSFKISALLNLIFDQVPKNKIDSFGNIMESILSLSSVTHIEATEGTIREATVSKRTLYSGFDEFSNMIDPDGTNKNFIELIKLVHDDVLNTFPDVQASYSKGRISFFNNDFPRRAKSFLQCVVNTLPILVRIEKESTEEPVPEGAVEAWLKREQWKCFAFELNGVQDYTDTVKNYIKRNYDLALKGFTLPQK